MAESQSLPQNETRRQFLRVLGFGTAASLAGFTAGAALGNEAQKGPEGKVVTSYGNFFPLYERHDVGISPSNVPNHLDLFFREVAQMAESETQLINAKPENIILRNILPQSTIDTIQSTKAEIVVGDVNTGSTTEYALTSMELEGLYLFSGFTPFLGLLLRKEGITRRTFLSTAILFSIWGETKLLSELALLGAFDKKGADSLKRISARVHGLISDFHPENAAIFFRNALMANNLLTAAKDKQVSLGHPPDVAFHVGAAHAGLEDFLQLGPEFCRKIILSYPKEFLQKIANSNGGVEALTTTRFFQMPSTGIHYNKFGLISETEAKHIKARKVVDKELLTALKNKLS